MPRRQRGWRNRRGEPDASGGGVSGFGFAGPDPDTEVDPEVKRMATRALAILGENELVRQAVGRKPVKGRGVRILCMDGGGIRGMSTIQMLRRLEKGTGKRVHELFDLVCGTSTGGILAMAVGVHNHSLDRCDEIYRDLGQQIFSNRAPPSRRRRARGATGWITCTPARARACSRRGAWGGTSASTTPPSSSLSCDRSAASPPEITAVRVGFVAAGPQRTKVFVV